MVEVITVHGTFAANDSDYGDQWWQVGSPFLKQLEKELEEHLEVKPFHWSGKNSENDRRRFARKLVRHIEGCNAPPIVIAHSHGGTVGFHALQELFRSTGQTPKIRKFVSVGMPLPLFGPSRSPLARLSTLETVLAVFSFLTLAIFLFGRELKPTGTFPRYTDVFRMNTFEWNLGNIFQHLAQHAPMIVAPILLLAIAVWGFAKRRSRYRYYQHPETGPVKGSSIISLFHRSDEAISLLTKLPHIDVRPLRFRRTFSTLFTATTFLSLVLVLVVELLTAKIDFSHHYNEGGLGDPQAFDLAAPHIPLFLGHTNSNHVEVISTRLRLAIFWREMRHVKQIRDDWNQQPRAGDILWARRYRTRTDLTKVHMSTIWNNEFHASLNEIRTSDEATLEWIEKLRWNSRSSYFLVPGTEEQRTEFTTAMRFLLQQIRVMGFHEFVEVNHKFFPVRATDGRIFEALAEHEEDRYLQDEAIISLKALTPSELARLDVIFSLVQQSGFSGLPQINYVAKRFAEEDCETGHQRECSISWTDYEWAAADLSPLRQGLFVAPTEEQRRADPSTLSLNGANGGSIHSIGVHTLAADSILYSPFDRSRARNSSVYDERSRLGSASLYADGFGLVPYHLRDAAIFGLSRPLVGAVGFAIEALFEKLGSMIHPRFSEFGDPFSRLQNVGPSTTLPGYGLPLLMGLLVLNCAIFSLAVAAVANLLLNSIVSASLRATAAGSDINGERVQKFTRSIDCNTDVDSSLPAAVEEEMEELSKRDLLAKISEIREAVSAPILSKGGDAIASITQFKAAELLHNAYFHSHSFIRYLASKLRED